MAGWQSTYWSSNLSVKTFYFDLFYILPYGFIIVIQAQLYAIGVYVLMSLSTHTYILFNTSPSKSP